MADATSSTNSRTISTSAGVAPLVTGRKAANTADFDFNLGATKGRVLKTLDDKVPAAFRRFFAGPLFDKILQTFLLYFTAVFQLEWVIATMEKSRKQHLEGYNPYIVAGRIRELEEESNTLRLELSPLYSQVILQHSSYEKPQQDRKFFEALYESVIAIMDEAFERLKKRADIEREVGSLFRSKHFNLYKRKNMQPRSVDTLGVKELYALKHETSNRALNARTLASLFEKPPSIGVTVASVTNSPLISQYIMSPIVARSMMKDPEQREALLGSNAALQRSAARSSRSPLGSAGTGQARLGGGQVQGDAYRREEHKAQRRDVGNVFKSAALLKGVDTAKLEDKLASMKLKPSDAADMGIMGPEKARRGDWVRGPQGLVAPEAAGLPVDENFNYLAFMKRYVMYGPSLGLQQTGGPGMGSGLGAAASGALSASFSTSAFNSLRQQVSSSGAAPPT